MEESLIPDTIHASQMFDPPYELISVVGVPIFMIPLSEIKYRSFLDWWFTVGRLAPGDPQEWSTMSGRWLMVGRSEAIPTSEWDALPESEKKLISSWANNLPIGAFFD